MQKTAFHEFYRQIFMSLSFFAEKVILVLKCTKITSLELLRTPILCLVQLSNYENVRPQMLKSFFLSQKKLLNAILRAKLNYMKNYSF